MNAEIRPSDLYRLPWSLTDNVLAWLEPTKRCNLYCEGCYSRNDPDSDKTLEEVKSDLDAFVSQRTVDSISIAGGDPLVHPRIVEIVRMIRHEYGLKPVINTNGLALTASLLAQLRDAGLYGFTFHVDSSQGRPGWKKADEVELNVLRLQLAEMVRDAGDLSVAFNATVFPHTVHHVPALVRWAREHVDLVHSMVFILFRTTRTAEFEFFAQGRPVDVDSLVYYDQDKNPEPLVAQDVIARIREEEPDFEPAAYLGGTKDPNSFKWLLSARLATRYATLGWLGPRYMEWVQTTHHAFAGRYLGYVRPSMLRHGRSMLLGFSALDDATRRMAGRWARSALRRPLAAATDRLHFQSILIIQPIDMMPDGETNMCDGCPDMTVHDGKLVWSCRLDELTTHGCLLTAAPRPPAEAK